MFCSQCGGQVATNDRFCRTCGHELGGVQVPLETVAPVMDAGEEGAAAADARATCWSCHRELPDGVWSECPSCGALQSPSRRQRVSAWEQRAGAEAPAAPASPDPPAGGQAPLVNVEVIRSGAFVPPSGPSTRPAVTSQAHVGGWGVAVFLFGVIGGFIGWLALRHTDSQRANHVLKWGAIWSAFFFLVTPIVTYLVLFATFKSFADSLGSTPSRQTPTVAETAPTRSDPVSQEEAIEIARSHAAVTPCTETGCVLLRYVQKGTPLRGFWLVDLRETVSGGRVATVLVDVETGQVESP